MRRKSDDPLLSEYEGKGVVNASRPDEPESGVQSWPGPLEGQSAFTLGGVDLATGEPHMEALGVSLHIRN